MTLYIGSRVRTSDGLHAGRVERVVVDPATGKPTDLVIFTDDGYLDYEVVVPLSAVRSATKAEVSLFATLLEAKSFPEYVEGDYTSPSSAWEATEGLTHAQVLFPVTRLPGVTVPNHALLVGMGVESTDGPAGVVEEVRVDPITFDPRSFVLRGLHRLDERFIVPIDWVESVRGRWVKLNCNSAQIHELLELPQTDPRLDHPQQKGQA